MLGKIVDASGLRGAVKIFPFADEPAAWAKLPCWWLASDAAVNAENWAKVALKTCRLQSTFMVAQFVGFSDRNAAEALCGNFIGVPKSALPPTQQGEFYWADLIGLRVINSEGISLGEVLGLIETPANNVLRVSRIDAPVLGEENQERKAHPLPERLLPFVGAVVLNVDLGNKVITVDWGEDW